MGHTSTIAVTASFVIVGSSHLEALRKRLAHDPAITVFGEADALGALRVMLENPPQVLLLDPAIARSGRGALIVSRLREHTATEIRVLNEANPHALAVLEDDVTLASGSRPIEDCGGTRKAKRFAMKPDVHAVVDGNKVTLVNLSVNGAQLVLPGRVQPMQSLRLTLVDNVIQKRFEARVAWSAVELAGSAVQYRAGVSFVDPDTSALEDFCLRNAVTRDQRRVLKSGPALLTDVIST